MFNFCVNLIIFELLLLWTLVASMDKDFGELESNECADAVEVILCFRLNTVVPHSCATPYDSIFTATPF